MKKIIWVLSLFLLIPAVFAVTPTFQDPSGLAIGSRSDYATAGVTVGRGDLFVADDATIADDLAVTGSRTSTGASIDSPTTSTRVAASSNTTITSGYSLIVVNCNVEDITSGATPTFSTATATNYQRMRVFVSSNAFTVQDEGTLTSSAIELIEGTTLTLSKGDWCDFYFYGGKWYQDGIPAHVTGNITTIGAIRTDGGIDVNEDVDIDFDANDEELDIATSSDSVSGRGIVRIRNTDTPDTQHYLLELYQQNSSADTDGDFLICKDSATSRTLATISENGNTFIAGTLAVTGVATLTAAPIFSAGKYGATDAPGNTVYSLVVSTVLATTEEFSLTPASGKAGGFDIIAGTHTARGSFTTGAVVTLTADGSGTATTSNGNADTLNVYDGGSVAIVENGTIGTLTAYIRYWYVN